MDTHTVLFLRNFFLRSFLVGILIAIALFVATFALQSIWMPLLTSGFNLEANEVSEVVLASLLNIRIVLLFLLLTPGLALHWMSKGKQ